MDKLSVIIPVYQVDKYLHECVDSVLSQTLKDIVVYLVDDGSEDESARVCDEFVKKDSRIVAIHRKNGGSSAARNSAFNFIETPYVSFLDSDDLLSSIFAYETIVCEMEKNGADLCLFAYRRFDDNGATPKIQKTNNIIQPRKFTQMDFQDWLADNSRNSHPVIVWNKVYKTELIKEMRFEETNLVEDSRFISNVFSVSNNIIRIDYPLVYYRVRLSSQSHGRSIKMCCDHVLSEMTVLDYIISTENNELIHNWLLRWIKLFFVDYFEVWKDKRKENEYDKRHYEYWKNACNSMDMYYNCVYPIIEDYSDLDKKVRRLCSLFKKNHSLAYYYFCLIRKELEGQYGNKTH